MPSFHVIISKTDKNRPMMASFIETMLHEWLSDDIRCVRTPTARDLRPVYPQNGQLSIILTKARLYFDYLEIKIPRPKISELWAVLHKYLYLNPIRLQYSLPLSNLRHIPGIFFHSASRCVAFSVWMEANGTLNATQQATNRTPTGVPLRENTFFAGVVLSGISPLV